MLRMRILNLFLCSVCVSVGFDCDRGFPVWLKYVPGISFRTDNEPFKVFLPLLAFCFMNIEVLCDLSI
jgi:hypothetical protein